MNGRPEEHQKGEGARMQIRTPWSDGASCRRPPCRLNSYFVGLHRLLALKDAINVTGRWPVSAANILRKGAQTTPLGELRDAVDGGQPKTAEHEGRAKSSWRRLAC
jgi:hypothetical protein